MTPDRPTRPDRPLRIGLTGPIGCGKSTVAGWLAERPGVVVIDADQVARDVLDRGEPALDAVARGSGGTCSWTMAPWTGPRSGRIVFADPAALRDLEAIVHPAVRPRILAAIAVADEEDADVVVIEAIKLVEGGLAEMCDEVWLVTCDAAAQRERIVGRGGSNDDADQRIAAQGGITERLRPAATRTIDTSADPATTRALVDAALAELLGGDRA